jgi:hypothetical protein
MPAGGPGSRRLNGWWRSSVDGVRGPTTSRMKAASCHALMLKNILPQITVWLLIEEAPALGGRSYLSLSHSVSACTLTDATRQVLEPWIPNS